MNLKKDNQQKNQLLTIFSKAVQAVNGCSCVTDYLLKNPVNEGAIWVVAIGKAAESMFQGVVNQYADRIEKALVITKQDHVERSHCYGENVSLIEAAHPYPDQTSLDAGAELIDFLHAVPQQRQIIFLISGGTSSLVEVVPADVSCDDLNKLNHWLLAQGWPINVMNAVRKSVSCIKAGRLLHYLKDNRVLQLLISDVPGDDISVIGSGLLVADNDIPIEKPMPDWVHAMQAGVPAKPASNNKSFEKIQTQLIANNEIARNAAVQVAIDHGYSVRCNQAINGELYKSRVMISEKLLNGKQGIYIWGGEVVIKLPANPGRGGRCQALALAVAEKIQGHDNIVVLAAGTDGTDGPGDVAGALIDGGTITRGMDAGFDLKSAKLNADSGCFLAGSGDLIDTGPTGTNVMDLVIAIKY